MTRPLLSALLVLVGAAFACSDQPATAPTPSPAPSAPSLPCDADLDGHLDPRCGGDDCDDTRSDIHPGAADTCDGDDNDCNGIVDQEQACDCAQPPEERSLPYSGRVCLPGGWFLMGMGQTDPDAVFFQYNSSPLHPVFVSPLYMDQYEATNERYLACVQQGACWLEPSVTGLIFDVEKHMTEDQKHRPFNWASVRMGQAFCEWQGGRLPTEAEWERAAAGLGDKPRPYPHGYTEPSCATDVIKDCFPDVEHPFPVKVGSKPANPEGLYDLGGNSFEFTRDVASYTAYRDCEAPCKNPCVGCDKPFPERGGPVSDANLFMTRGGVVWLSYESPALKPFFRAQARDQSDVDFVGSEVSAAAIRCAYPTAPRR